MNIYDILTVTREPDKKIPMFGNMRYPLILRWENSPYYVSLVVESEDGNHFGDLHFLDDNGLQAVSKLYFLYPEDIFEVFAHSGFRSTIEKKKKNLMDITRQVVGGY